MCQKDEEIRLRLSRGLKVEEDLVLVDEAKNAAVDKIIVNHLDSSMMGPIPPEKQVEMDRKGAYSNLLINAGWFGFDPFDFVAQVKKIGTEHFMLSRDVGQSCNANPIEEPTSHIKLFAFCLLDPKSIETITKQNPANVLSLK